jgi:TolA-binding protein
MYPDEQSAEKAMLHWGKIYLSDVKDYASAAEIFVEYLAEYNNPDNRRIPEVLNMLALCYEKTGKAQQAAAISARLQEGYPDGAFVQSVVDEYK